MICPKCSRIVYTKHTNCSAKPLPFRAYVYLALGLLLALGVVVGYVWAVIEFMKG